MRRIAWIVVGPAVLLAAAVGLRAGPGLVDSGTQEQPSRMTCAEARSEVLNKEATARFVASQGGSLGAVHDFLKASDYELRNIGAHPGHGTLTFVYTARHYVRTCDWGRVGLIDGTIICLHTDLTAEPQVVSVD